MKKILAFLIVLLIAGNLVCLPAYAEETDLERVISLIETLPDTYQAGSGDLIAEIDGLITENGFTRNDIGVANYTKFYAKHVSLHNAWLSRTINQDRIKINWQERNKLACVDMFEFSGATVDRIATKPGIVMSSYNNVHFPGTLATGSYIGFYETSTVKSNYPNTFPDKYGEYFITENSVQFEYSDISEEIGEVSYNAGIVSTNYSYEIPFDGYTNYGKVDILVSGTNYLSGEYARQVIPVNITVEYADGSEEESFHIVGPFCYSYRMTLYSMLDGVMYTEFLGSTNTLAKDLDKLWKPEEANADSYFKLGYGLNSRTSYGVDNGLGNATVLSVNTKNKPLKSVKVSIATEEQLVDMGAIKVSSFTTKEDTPREIGSTAAHFLKIDKKQLSDAPSYNENADYYMALICNASFPVYLHAVTGSKTEGSTYNQQIAEINALVESVGEEVTEDEFQVFYEIKSRYDFLLSQGVSKSDFGKEENQKIEELITYNLKNGRYTVYVSPLGDDNSIGTREKPLKTLEGAKDFVKSLPRTYPIDVIFLEGEYNFDETVYFVAEDSGTEEGPVTYKAEGEVVFTTKDVLEFEDFQLAGKNEDERISPELIGKIYKLNLTEYGIEAGEMPTFQKTGIVGDGFDDVEFFVNNKSQLVAQWPNGESNYDSWVDVADNSANGVIIQADAMRSKRWQGEKFAYFEGYPAPDYSNERNNLVIEGDLLKFQNEARTGADERHSRRYKVKHLLSELDVPGEWYIDRDTNILYYYPTEDFNESSVIEISAKKLDVLNFRNTKNINIDGITFDKVRGDAINAANYLKALNVYNCTFSNITNRAIAYNAKTNYGGILHSTANYTDGAESCEIRNNKFVNIGSSAILLLGGHRESLSSGNNVIANNYIYNAGNKQRCTPVISINGVYNYVLNNELHNIPFHALNHSGNENVIAHNEFYNALRDTGDCGVIYSGRQLATRGTEIAYNYIHHYKHLDKRTTDNGVGIYLDDRLSGIYVHHNITYADGVGQDGNGIQNGSGQHDIFEYNIAVDCDEAMTGANRLIEDHITSSTAFDEIIRISGLTNDDKIYLDDGTWKSYSMLGKNELFFETYPEMEESITTLFDPNTSVKAFVEKYPYLLTVSKYNGGQYGNLKEDIEQGNDLTKYMLLSLKSPICNVYRGNIANTSWRESFPHDVYLGLGGVEENNVVNASNDIFVDYENQDFRIKSDLGFEGYIDETFDLDTIGLREDGNVSYDFLLSDYQVENPRVITEEEKQFNLTYPENNSKVKDVKNVTFMWERPVSSDYFTLEIATDPQMENIVYKNENSYYNFETVTTLPEDVDTFYWRVEARNISRKDGSKWQNSDGVNVFHTYDGAYVEIPASVPFDIEADFNKDVFSNEGETNNGSLLGGKNNTLGMYNLTNFKRLVAKDGYHRYGDTLYHFPQVGYDTNSNHVVDTKTIGGDYTYTLKENEKRNYDYIRVAMSAQSVATDYEIDVNYTDGTKDTSYVELSQYYTTYYNNEGMNIIIIVDGVNYLGDPVQDSCKNKIYQIELDADINKTVESITFNYRSGNIRGSVNGQSEMIFAISGITGERTANNINKKAFVINNYSGEEKELVLIATGEKDGKFKSKIITATLKGSNNLPHIPVEIPEEVYTWTNRKLFTWENGKMAPFTAIENLIK